MKLKSLSTSWNGIKSENTFLRILVPLLITAIVVLSIIMKNRESPIAVVPWTLDHKVEFSRNNGDVGTKKMWAMAVAELIGNITPGNADFVVNKLERMLSPDIFSVLKTNLADQVEEIKHESFTTNFTPQDIIYEKKTDKIFVAGRMEMSGASGASMTFIRTYEFKIEINNWYPKIIHFDVYKGQPKLWTSS